MAKLDIRKRKFKPAKNIRVEWDSFRRGLDTLQRDSELSPESSRELTNLFLEGKGIISTRPGTGNYYLASESGKIRGMYGSKINSVAELLTVADDGYLARPSGASYERITGASWASGSKVRMTQLQSKVWIVQPERPITRYDGSTLLSYTSVAEPTGLTATNLSGVSGIYQWSWRVAAETDSGLTLASDPIVLANLPEDLSTSPVQVSWTAPSAASGLITGYSIFGRDSGNESRLTRVDSSVTSFIDDGSYTPSQVAFLPDYNETGGVRAKYVIKSAGKVVVANVTNYPSRIQWSGADVNVGKFHWTKGGGYYDIDKDDGTEITGVAETSENRIIVWKERAIYQVKLTYNADLGIVEPVVQKITDSIGCLSGDTILTAENDIYFVGRRAGGGVSLNSLGYQPNILANVLRTAELSPQIRPNLEVVNKARYEDMFAMFYDQKYYFFYPISNTMRCIIYDFERRSFTGPHTFPDNPVVGTVYYDSDNQERLVYGDGDDGYITEISKSFDGDKGTPFSWTFTSRNEDFGYNFRLKTLLKVMTHIANVSGGSVSVQIFTTDRTGNAKTEASFTIEATNNLAGFGSFAWGSGIRYGSSQQVSISTTNTSDVRRIIDMNKSGVVSAQIKIQSTDGAKAKIIEVGMTARPEAEQNIPSEWMAQAV